MCNVDPNDPKQAYYNQEQEQGSSSEYSNPRNGITTPKKSSNDSNDKADRDKAGKVYDTH